jgi:endo-1,4-beta-xylanase
MNISGGFKNKEEIYNNSLSQLSDFPIGVAVQQESFVSDKKYKELLTWEFNSITAENIFKFSSLQPERNYFRWEPADQLAGYCEYHTKRLHGHTLVWGEDLPPWLNAGVLSGAECSEIFHSHITAVAGRFQGKVHSWDVVNEAFDHSGNLKNTFWKEKLGTDYFKNAFRIAKETDTSALLFYNDFDLECNPQKRSKVLKYLNDCRNEGISIDGIGLQMHVNIHTLNKKEIETALNEISEAGYTIHISELDLSVYNKTKTTSTDQLLAMQAGCLSWLTGAYKTLPKKYQYGITFWGLSDDHSWTRHNNEAENPLLFDRNLQPKPAYFALKEKLSQTTLNSK